MPAENIAIIDLGTNTFHLLIAEIDEHENYVIKGKFKEPVQLGRGGINAGKITEDAFKRGIRALKTFRNLLDSNGIVKVFANATSAIRSASNGQEFVKAAKEEANIDIKTINGNEEAAIIFEGVKNGVQLPFEEHVLLVDIGGGSVEFIVAYEGKAELLRSINIGGARLLDKIKPADPIQPKQIAELFALFDKEMGGLIAELREFDLTMLVGSSGTCETVGNLVAYQKKDKVSQNSVNGYRFSHNDFLNVYHRLLPSTLAERQATEGIDVMRAEMIVLGVALLHYVFRELEIPEMMISTQALKEGVLNRYIREKKIRLSQYLGASDSNIRASAILKLAKKYQYEEEHCVKVSELASILFDELQAQHQLGRTEKELLKYAAILHDIGKFIQTSSHHKHGQYIIANSNIAGFTTAELLLISNLVRYHRKSPPKNDHLPYQMLAPKDKKTVQVLAAILRIAANLDIGNRNLVHHLRISLSPEKILIEAQANQEIEIEIKAATEVSDMLAQVLARKVEIRQRVGK
ncbi:MAG: HD domain-containing protein [Bacteroidia bacterium]